MEPAFSETPDSRTRFSGARAWFHQDPFTVNCSFMHSLDNPTWAALTTRQSHWAQIEGMARRFPADVCVHGAFAGPTPEAWQNLAHLANRPVGILSLQPLEIPPGWTVTRKVELYEMVQESPGGEPSQSNEMPIARPGYTNRLPYCGRSSTNVSSL